MPAVCVYCASSERIDGRYTDLAARVGTELARRGHTLVSGGGRVSCMGAVARAARVCGARTVGVIPRVLVDWEIADDDCDELVVTDDMRERKGEMERRSDGFLALPGGLGTLEELFEIWVGRVLGLHGKPLVVVNADGFFDHLRAQVDVLSARGFLRGEALRAVVWASEVGEAFDLLEEAWARRIAGAEDADVVPTDEEVLESEP
ncbi:MAG: TIGR00730 family Rossman fold protein [Carbonactinosporaceae bacterium]